MNGRAIRIVYGKELRDSLRDRRTIISMIVVPVLVIPLLMFGLGTLMFKTVTKARRKIPRVMIIGGENSPKVLAALHAAKNLQIVPATANFTNQIVEKRVSAAVQTAAGFRRGGCPRGEDRGEIYEYETEMKSGFAAERLNAFFQNLRDATVRERLKAGVFRWRCWSRSRFNGRMSRRRRRWPEACWAGCCSISSSSCP